MLSYQLKEKQQSAYESLCACRDQLVRTRCPFSPGRCGLLLTGMWLCRRQASVAVSLQGLHQDLNIAKGKHEGVFVALNTDYIGESHWNSWMHRGGDGRADAWR